MTKIPDTTQLRVVAVHKETFETIEKIMTYSEWINIKKNTKYNYYAYQIN